MTPQLTSHPVIRLRASAAAPAASGRVALLAGELRTVRLPRPGAAICCEGGRLWVTQTGDAADTLLLPGQRLRLLPGRTAVAEALAPSVVRFE